VKILIADAVDPKSVEIFSAGGFETVYRPEISAAELLGEVGEYTALIVRSRTQVTSDVLKAGSVLIMGGRAGAGVDNIDVGEATRRGIIVMNTPGGNTVSTAEHTIAMMLALSRNIPGADRSVREMKWERKKFTGTEVSGKTLGLIGLGKVGSEVARKATGLDMHVVAFDPLVPGDVVAKSGIELVDLPELYRRSDYISVHTPLTTETGNLLCAATFAKCKQGVRIINCARGGIVNEKDLLAALDTGRVAGAALDVFEKEPPESRELLNHPAVVCTPHLGASTGEAQEKVALQIAHQVSDFLAGHGIAGSVNADQVRFSMRREIRPYLDLSGKMGLLLSQLRPGQITAVNIVLRGELHHDAREVIQAAFLVGLLSPLLDETVNLVNAGLIAKERGISIRTVSDAEPSRYPLEISAESHAGSLKKTVIGTVFGNEDVRIIGIDDYRFEMKPMGHHLIYYNIDRPGMLAAVSRVLAERSVNIADLSLGRLKPGERALTVIATDQPVSQDIREKIMLIEGISDVSSVFIH
jgi:D-3-phosphoglycerate dehydrogenase